ncbi:MAG: sulfite exporter TauE/SafE family protein [Acutalibacteraceae bacterium]|nr:sulfite exporter TauE/SafE family protein [Acutalibacteraceae bacterium]
MKWAALLAGLFSGIIGAMGLGGGAVLIIYLSLFTDMPQLKAQGVNLLFFIPTAVAAVTVYGIKKQIKWKIVLKVALWGLLGAVVGIYFADLLGGKLTSKLFGGLLVVMGVIEIFSKKGCGRDK